MIFAATRMRQLADYQIVYFFTGLAILVPPVNLVGLPIGIWALVVLSRPGVRNAFGQGMKMGTVPFGTDPVSWPSPSVARPESAKGMGLAREKPATQPTEPNHEATLGAITAAAVMFAVLIFSAFAMWVTGSVWCLIALCVPGFIAPGLENLARRAGTVWIFFATAGLTLIGSLALIAYGVWLTDSLWPLWAIFAPFVGMGAGVAAWQGEEVSSERAEPPEEAANLDEKTGTVPVRLPLEATEQRLVQAPADCLLLAAGIAFATACGVAAWLLAAPTSSLLSSLVSGNLIIASVTLAIYSVLIGVAGLMLRRLRARLFVLLVVVVVGLFLPAVVALNVVMEFRNIPNWPVAIPLWLGTPAALWVAFSLFRVDVRRDFDAAARRRISNRQ